MTCRHTVVITSVTNQNECSPTFTFAWPCSPTAEKLVVLHSRLLSVHGIAYAKFERVSRLQPSSMPFHLTLVFLYDMFMNYLACTCAGVAAALAASSLALEETEPIISREARQHATYL